MCIWFVIDYGVFIMILKGIGGDDFIIRCYGWCEVVIFSGNDYMLF